MKKNLSLRITALRGRGNSAGCTGNGTRIVISNKWEVLFSAGGASVDELRSRLQDHPGFVPGLVIGFKKV